MSRNCSSPTLWSLSHWYYFLICHLWLPIWFVLAYTATSHHPSFWSVTLIFLLQQDSLGGVVCIIIFHVLFYFISFHFVCFSYHLYFSLSLFFYFETCMQAWRSTGGWRWTHDRLFFSLILIFCTVTAHPLIICTLYNQLLASSHSIAYYIRGGCWGKLSIFQIKSIICETWN